MNRIPLLIRIAIVLLILAAIGAVSMGCNTAKRAHQYANAHPEEFAEFCAEEYPVKDSLVVRDSVHFDTLYVEGVTLTDTLVIEGKTVILDRPCPPQRVVTKVVRKDSTIYRENTARVAHLGAEIKAKEKQITEDKQYIKWIEGKANWWRSACVLTWLIVGVYILLKVFSSRLLSTAKGFFTGV